jgi:hypothetical protein
MARHLAAHQELVLTPDLEARLAQISVSTVRRRLQRLRQDEPQLARRPRAALPAVAQLIPMKRIPWDERQPGHFELDLVHHAGVSSAGQYIHTLQMVDAASGWSERAAVLGRSYLVMADGFQRCQARLPFALLELHPDNGSEFLNDLMVDLWRNRAEVPQLSRSRPWHKNDNRFVEQKNHSLVRAYLGQRRLDTVRQTRLLNQLYDRMWLYHNFFQPVLRLKEKVVVPDADGHRLQRRFDCPQTPFERVGASGVLAPPRQLALTRLRDRTNPRQLRADLYDLIEQILALPGARPERTEPVRQTLWPAGCWELLQPFLSLPATPPAGSSPLRPTSASSRASRLVGVRS